MFIHRNTKPTDSQRQRHTHTTKQIHRDKQRQADRKSQRYTHIFREIDNRVRHGSSNMDTHNNEHRYRETHVATTKRHTFSEEQKHGHTL